MRKEEFLERLSEALREYMDNGSAYEHVNYYSNYINEEIRKGSKEEDVVASLGSPRLIAKSIIDRGNYSSDNVSYTTYDKKDNESKEDNNKVYSSLYINGKSVNSALAKVISIIIGVLIIGVIVLVLWGISWLVLRVIMPIVVLVILVVLVLGLIKQSKR